MKLLSWLLRALWGLYRGFQSRGWQRPWKFDLGCQIIFVRILDSLMACNQFLLVIICRITAFVDENFGHNRRRPQFPLHSKKSGGKRYCFVNSSTLRLQWPRIMIKAVFVIGKHRQTTETGNAKWKRKIHRWMWDKQKEVVIEWLLENVYR